MSAGIRKRQGKFEQIPRWIVERADANSLRLWLILAKYADWQTGEAFPSRARLAEDLGVSLDTVDRSKKRLMEIGALTWERRGSEEKGYESNLYTLEWDDPLAADLRPPSRTDAAPPSRMDAALTNTQSYPEKDPQHRFARCGGCQRRHDPKESCF